MCARTTHACGMGECKEKKRTIPVRLFFSDGKKPEEDLNCKRSDRPSNPVEGLDFTLERLGADLGVSIPSLFSCSLSLPPCYREEIDLLHNSIKSNPPHTITLYSFATEMEILYQQGSTTIDLTQCPQKHKVSWPFF